MISNWGQAYSNFWRRMFVGAARLYAHEHVIRCKIEAEKAALSARVDDLVGLVNSLEDDIEEALAKLNGGKGG